MKKNPIIYIMAFLYAMPALSATETENLSAALKTSGYQPSYGSILLSLVFVILLIYVTGIAYAKLNKFGIKTIKREFKDNLDIKPVVLSTTPIGNNKTLQVVEINGERLLIGVTQNNVSLIKNLGSADIEIKEPKNIAKEETFQTQKTTEEHIINEEDFGLYKKYLR